MDQVVQVFPSFRLPFLDGGEFTSEYLKSHPATLLVFFKIDCDASRLVIRLLQSLWSRLPEKQPIIFLIGQDEVEMLQEWTVENQISIPVAMDAPGYELSRELAFTFVPILYLLDSEKRVILKTDGFVKSEFISIISELFNRNRIEPFPVFEDESRIPELKPG